MTLEELVQRYLDEMAPRWSERTLVRSRTDLDRMALCLGGRARLTRARVVAFVRYVQSRTVKGRPWSPVTIAGVLVRARCFLRWALLRGHILEDLGALIDPPSFKTLPRMLSESEVVRLIEEGPRGACAVRDRAVIELVYGTGLRAKEAVCLGVDDVDFAAGLVYVRQGKNRKDRVVPLGARAADAVREYLRHDRPARSGPLFLRVDGSPLSRGGLAEILRRAGRRAGLARPASPHKLRHSYATHLLRGGADIVAIKNLLGHSSLTSTQVYLDVDVNDLAAMVDKCHPRERRGKVGQ